MRNINTKQTSWDGIKTSNVPGLHMLCSVAEMRTQNGGPYMFVGVYVCVSGGGEQQAPFYRGCHFWLHKEFHFNPEPFHR